ncbi:MAG: hypothetical protein HQL37_09840 [Alphaproteobacteria bacterium]|nr:hypothetical protein [Alphaproteobacteria bacterium]
MSMIASHRLQRLRYLWFATATTVGCGITTAALGSVVERVLTGYAGTGVGLGPGLVTVILLVSAFALGRSWLMGAAGSDGKSVLPAIGLAVIAPAAGEDESRNERPCEEGTGACGTPPCDQRAALVVTELQAYHFFTNLLRSQTQDIIETTEAAATSIVTALQQVDRAISDMMGFLEQSSANDRVAEIVDRTEQEMHLNRKMLQEFMDQRARDATDAVVRQEEIREATDHLVGMVRHVREIASATNMLALNATIEAARAGDAGRGFLVVASEVKALSRQSDQTARDLHSGIERLQATIANSLETIIHQHVDEESKSLTLVTKTITDLTDNLEKLISHQRDVLTKVQHESEAIARPIMELMGSIQFQDITRQQLQHLSTASMLVDDHVEAMCRVLEDTSSVPEIIPLQTLMEDVFNRYVMASQRDSHREAGGQTAMEDGGPKIELF